MMLVSMTSPGEGTVLAQGLQGKIALLAALTEGKNL
jgi:hypothetical protein